MSDKFTQGTIIEYIRSTKIKPNRTKSPIQNCIEIISNLRV